MGQFDALKAELKDIYRKRNVNRVVYFHCDHWEPWKQTPGQSVINERNAEDVAAFVDSVRKIDFARKLTLFYKPNIQHSIDDTGRPGYRVHPDDGIVFAEKTDEQFEICRRAIRYVSDGSRHELQVHIHHENFTYNHAHSSERAKAYFSTPESRVHEEARLDLAIKLWLKEIEREAGISLDRWFFVHGHWGLNASDPKVCHITREIEILMSNGCLGDFTVPSGRPNVNPRIEVPYFCRPFDAPKGYDSAEAEPELAYGNKSAALEKFFIWSSDIKHAGSGLDYYASWVRKRLDEMNDLAKEICQKSYVVDGIMFIKSHGHSMHPGYFEDTRVPIFPHQMPQIQNLFCVLFDAAAAAGSTVEFLTASEVYDLFVSADRKPAEGFALEPRGTPIDLSEISPPPPNLVILPRARRPQAAAPAITGNVHRERLEPTRQSASEPIAQKKREVASGRPEIEKPPLSVEKGGLSALSAKRSKGGNLRIVGEHSVINHIEINDVAVALVKEFIAASNETDSGAGSFYATRASRLSMMSDCEVELVKYLCNEDFRDKQLYEIGCGLGALSVLLAANGFKITGIETNGKRLAMAVALRDRARAQGLLSASCEFIHGRFPYCLAETDLSQSVALMTNVSARLDEPERAKFIEGLARFPIIIVDLAHLLEERLDETSQANNLETLLRAGFGMEKQIFRIGNQGNYYVMLNKAMHQDAAAMPMLAAAG
jgi:precorrin-6B methylase 2